MGTAQPWRRDDADDGTGHHPHGEHAAQLAVGRAANDDPAVDRCEEHVLDVGGFERERSAVGSRAQADAHRERHEDAHDFRPMVPHRVDGVAAGGGVADDEGQRHQRGDRRDADHVGPVERIDPVEVSEPLDAATGS